MATNSNDFVAATVYFSLHGTPLPERFVIVGSLDKFVSVFSVSVHSLLG
jgi:hypothetical protein